MNADGATSGYHHGNLPTALKIAAVEVLTEKGPAGFSLREVARRAGVSHAAPAHHFGHTTGLLTALACDAFKVLDEAMTRAAEGASDPADRLARIGRAYVEVGQTHPAHCAVVFRPDLVDTTDADYLAWGDRAYGHVVAALEAVREAENPNLPVEDAARLCWSTMQGLVVLHPGMPNREQSHGGTLMSAGDMADRFSGLILDGLRNSR